MKKNPEPLSTITVQPVKGQKVRIPEAGMQPLTGPAVVPRNSFWLKRIALGEVERVDTPKSKAKK